MKHHICCIFERNMWTVGHRLPNDTGGCLRQRLYVQSHPTPALSARLAGQYYTGLARLDRGPSLAVLFGRGTDLFLWIEGF